MKETKQNLITEIKKRENSPPSPPTSGSNINEPFEREIDRIKREFSNLPIQQLNLKPNEKSYEYYKGFYDATYNFMSTFSKLLDSGVLNGTKFNADN